MDTFNWNDAYAKRETPWDSGEPSRELGRVLEQGLVKPGRTLELGCGTGTNAVFLAQKKFDVTAFDLSALAIEQANSRAKAAKVAAKFTVGDVLHLPDVGKFDFVFDRGVYHHLRNVDLFGFLKTLERVTRAGSLYLTLAGNANEVRAEGQQGPPQVYAHDLCKELSPLFDLIQLREFRFDGVIIEGRQIAPLAWSALLRRKG